MILPTLLPSTKGNPPKEPTLVFSLYFCRGKGEWQKKSFGLWRAHSSWKTLPNRLADVMITKQPEKAGLALLESSE